MRLTEPVYVLWYVPWTFKLNWLRSLWYVLRYVYGTLETNYVPRTTNDNKSFRLTLKTYELRNTKL